MDIRGHIYNSLNGGSGIMDFRGHIYNSLQAGLYLSSKVRYTTTSIQTARSRET
jgi:hypothetical protein